MELLCSISDFIISSFDNNLVSSAFGGIIVAIFSYIINSIRIREQSRYNTAKDLCNSIDSLRDNGIKYWTNTHSKNSHQLLSFSKKNLAGKIKREDCKFFKNNDCKKDFITFTSLVIDEEGVEREDDKGLPMGGTHIISINRAAEILKDSIYKHYKVKSIK